MNGFKTERRIEGSLLLFSICFVISAAISIIQAFYTASILLDVIKDLIRNGYPLAMMLTAKMSMLLLFEASFKLFLAVYNSVIVILLFRKRFSFTHHATSSFYIWFLYIGLDYFVYYCIPPVLTEFKELLTDKSALLVLVCGILWRIAGTIYIKTSKRVKAVYSSHCIQASPPVVAGLSGKFAGTVVGLGNGQVVFGRDPAVCQLVFSPDAERISPKHCVLWHDPARGSFILQDFSVYGTFFDNGERLASHAMYELKSGNRFYLGDTTNLFEVRGDAGIH